MKTLFSDEPPFWARAASFVAALAVFGWLLFGGFLSGRDIFMHDSLQGLGVQKIFYEYLFSGKIALWSPELNAGHPLWQLIETFPVVDPVAALAWGMGRLLRADAMYVFETVCIAWLAIFASGGMLLSRLILRSWWLNLTVFILLFGGPLGLAIPAQWSFIGPFRYTPFVVLALIRLIVSPGWHRALLLGVLCGASASGYQTGYSALFVSVFGAAYLLFLKYRGQYSISSALIRQLLFAAALGLLLNAPMIYAGLELLDMVAMPRLVIEGGWIMSTALFVASFSGLGVSPWHGNVFVGVCASAVIAFAVCWAVAAQAARAFFPASFSRIFGKLPELSALELAWLASTCVMVIFCLGLFGLREHLALHTFLGLRNWGLVLPAVLLGMAQLFVIGARRFSGAWASDLPLAALCLLGAALVSKALGMLGVRGTWVVFFIPLSLLGYSLLRRLTSKESFEFGLAVVCVFCLLFTLRVPYRELYSKGEGYRTGVIGVPKPEFIQRRLWMFKAADHFPMVVEGPALVGRQYAFMETKAESVVIDLIHLPRYHKLLLGDVNVACGTKILGVSAPILRTVRSMAPVPDADAALSQLRLAGDCSSEAEPVPVEGEFPLALLEMGQSPPSVPQDEVSVKSYGATRLEADVEMRDNGLLLYSDNWERHWKAYVDGKSAPLLVANLMSKAVFLGRGRHTVLFVYSPMVYLFLFWARLALYALAAGFLCLRLFRTAEA